MFGDFQSPRLSPDEPSIQPIEASQLGGFTISRDTPFELFTGDGGATVPKPIVEIGHLRYMTRCSFRSGTARRQEVEVKISFNVVSSFRLLGDQAIPVADSFFNCCRSSLCACRLWWVSNRCPLWRLFAKVRAIRTRGRLKFRPHIFRTAERR